MENRRREESLIIDQYRELEHKIISKIKVASIGVVLGVGQNFMSVKLIPSGGQEVIVKTINVLSEAKLNDLVVLLFLDDFTPFLDKNLRSDLKGEKHSYNNAFALQVINVGGQNGTNRD